MAVSFVDYNKNNMIKRSDQLLTVSDLDSFVNDINPFEYISCNPIKYTDTIGYYHELKNKGDNIKSAYNVTNCLSVCLHLKSFNASVINNAIIDVNGIKYALIVPRDFEWIEVPLEGKVSGVIKISLYKELTDSDGFPVSIIIDSIKVRTSLDYMNSLISNKYVATKPVIYNDTYGYYNILDANYDINFIYSSTSLREILLYIESANTSITGDIVIEVSCGDFSQEFVISVNETKTAESLSLSKALNGYVKIVRKTDDTRDTLKDASKYVVSAIVTDIVTYEDRIQ